MYTFGKCNDNIYICYMHIYVVHIYIIYRARQKCLRTPMNLIPLHSGRPDGGVNENRLYVKQIDIYEARIYVVEMPIALRFETIRENANRVL